MVRNLSRRALCALLLLSLLLPLFTGCASWGTPGLDDMVEDFFQAVDERDAEAVKALFAPNVLAEDGDMDEMIERLFALYSGPTEECSTDTPPGRSSRRAWKKKTTVRNWYPIVSGGVNYYCHVSYTSRDDEDKGNIGLQDVIFVTEKVRCSQEFQELWKELDDGLTVIEDVEGDFQTCRIGDRAYVYTPTDQAVTLEDILSFLEEERDYEAFLRRFGEPNVVYYYINTSFNVYYVLPDEGGEKRYAEIGLQEDEGRKVIRAVYLWTDRGYHSLGVQWQYEEE